MKPGKREHATASASIGYSMLVDAHLRGRLREITALSTPDADQRKGYGTALMHSICQEADQSSIVLMLMPDTEELAFWYERFGFKPIQFDPVIMMRPAR